MTYDNQSIEMDNITLEDCLELYRMKNIFIEINDGHIIKLVKE